jgi:hypothetical protein
MMQRREIYNPNGKPENYLIKKQEPTPYLYMEWVVR